MRFYYFVLLLNTSLVVATILLSSSTVSSALNVKKTYNWALGLRDILVRQEKAWLVSCIVAYSYTLVISPFVDMVDRHLYRRLVLQDLLVTYPCRAVALL